MIPVVVTGLMPEKFLEISGILGAMLALAAVRFGEIKLRRAWLPIHGCVPWCFRASLATCLTGCLVLGAIGWLEEEIPHLWIRTNRVEITAGVTDLNDSAIRAGTELNCLVEWQLSQGGWNPLTFRRACPLWSVEKIQFLPTPYKQPAPVGWILRSGRQRLTCDANGTDPLPWTGDGLARVFEQLGARPFSPEEHQALALAIEPYCRESGEGPIYDASVNAAFGTKQVTIKTQWLDRSEKPSPWLIGIFSGVLLTSLALAMRFTARATMGKPAAFMR